MFISQISRHESSCMNLLSTGTEKQEKKIERDRHIEEGGEGREGRKSDRNRAREREKRGQLVDIKGSLQ